MSVYLKAIGVLEERGWHQGSFEGQDGAVCVMGALRLASGLHLWGGDYLPEDVVNALYGCVGGNVAHFNDDPATSYEDVVLALKRAHELSEAS